MTGLARAAWLAARVLPTTAIVSPLGWTVLACTVGAWLFGWQLGWVEFSLMAGTGLFALVLCALLTIGRTTLRVTVDVQPARLVAGTPAAGRVTTHNLARTRLLPIALELPVGPATARFDLPSLAGGATHEELFVAPTARRGVIPIGPATTVRGDPFGLVRRKVSWTGVTELFVHPVTVALESFGSGLLRDMEGRTTNEMSMSDLAFHTLREYAPGDDRRYIHWRSSAKVAAGAPDGRFLVRQFQDTRRSHLLLVVDGDPACYRDADDFETAVSVAASVAVRAVRDEMTVTVVAAGRVVRSETVQRTLDGFAGVSADPLPLGDATANGARVAPDASVVLLVTGAAPTFTDLHRAASYCPQEVAKLALRVDPAADAGVSAAGPLTMLTLSGLADLPALLRAVSVR